MLKHAIPEPLIDKQLIIKRYIRLSLPFMPLTNTFITLIGIATDTDRQKDRQTDRTLQIKVALKQ